MRTNQPNLQTKLRFKKKEQPSTSAILRVSKIIALATTKSFLGQTFHTISLRFKNVGKTGDEKKAYLAQRSMAKKRWTTNWRNLHTTLNLITVTTLM